MLAAAARLPQAFDHGVYNVVFLSKLSQPENGFYSPPDSYTYAVHAPERSRYDVQKEVENERRKKTENK